MAYAMSMDNFLGLTILVYDDMGTILINDPWIRGFADSQNTEDTSE